MRSNFSMQFNNSRLQEAFFFFFDSCMCSWHHVSELPSMGVVFLAGIWVKHMWTRLLQLPWTLETSDLQSLIIPPEKSVSCSVFSKGWRKKKSGWDKRGKNKAEKRRSGSLPNNHGAMESSFRPVWGQSPHESAGCFLAWCSHSTPSCLCCTFHGHGIELCTAGSSKKTWNRMIKNEHKVKLEVKRSSLQANTFLKMYGLGCLGGSVS